MEVISLGTCNMDFILKVPRFVEIDSEMYIETINTSPGGSALNFAVNLSRNGIKMGLIARLGNDDYGKIILSKVSRENMDISRCLTLNDQTGMAFISVDKGGKRSIYSFMGANAKLNLLKEDIDYIKSSPFTHLTGVYWEVAYDVAQYAPKLSFSPGSLLSSYGVDKLKRVLKKTELLFLNEKEVNILTGEKTYEGSQLLLEEGVSNVIVTRGKEGAIIYSRDNTISASTKKVKALDTTGAGDAFAAGFVFKWLKGEKEEKCLEFANQSAFRCLNILGGIN
ncbi:carbohydrate kinase family protein [Methanobacterium movens]